MPHEGHLAGNRQLGRGGPVRLDEVGLPSDDNKLEARVVELAQRLNEQGKGLAPEVPERGEDDVGVVEAEAGAYRPAVEALRPPHPVDVDALGMMSILAAVVGYSSSSLRASPCDGTTMRRMQPNTQGSAMAWRRWSSQRSLSCTVLRLAVSFRRNAPQQKWTYDRSPNASLLSTTWTRS
jgi:hypothetical protein